MNTKKRSPMGSSLSEMTVELLRKDMAFREQYVKTALGEQNPALLGARLRNIVEALGGIGKLSKTSGLNRQSLYKSLSGNRKPDLNTVEKIFDFAGFLLSVERKKDPQKRELIHA